MSPWRRTNKQPESENRAVEAGTDSLQAHGNPIPGERNTNVNAGTETMCKLDKKKLFSIHRKLLLNAHRDPGICWQDDTQTLAAMVEC